MSLGEFDLIARYFTRPARRAALGVGDDCALLAPAPGMQLADLDRHAGRGPALPVHRRRPIALGHKALAVNLSDLAACGARPLAFTLALGAAARRRGLPRRLRARPVRARRRARLRAGRRRHDARPAHHLHHRLRRGAGRAARCCARARAPATTSRSAARSATRASRWRRFAAGRARRRRPSTQARRAMERPSRAWRSAWRCAASRRSAIDVSDGLLGDLGHMLRRSRRRRDVDVDACRAAPCSPPQPIDAAARVPARRRRRLRAALHRAGAAHAKRVDAGGRQRRGRGRDAHRPHRRRAPGLRLVDRRRRAGARAEFALVRPLPA